MLDTLFNMLNGGFTLAIAASFIWGIMSVVISPCHLSIIPLIIGYLQSQKDGKQGNAFFLSFVFSLGILISLIIVGGITYALGRIIGDIGVFGNILLIFVMLVFGLYFLGVLKLDWSLTTIKSGKHNGALGALLLGFIFGIGLGPCTFAFMAPILGIVLTQSSTGILIPLMYFFAFALGHCLVISLAGGMTDLISKYLKWNESSGAITIIKKVCGVLMLIAAAYMIYRDFIS